MTLAGGGWTLIARSAIGASGGSSGWRQSLGNVNNTGAYPLDAQTIGAFTIVVFGKRGGKQHRPPNFMKPFPPNSIVVDEHGALDVDALLLDLLDRSLTRHSRRPKP